MTKEKLKMDKKEIAKNTTNNKETKYCTLLKSSSIQDKEHGYRYAIEKIYIKELNREEIRICLYKNMKDRSGKLSNRMLVRPVDVTEKELLELLGVSIKENMFSEEFMKYLKNLVNGK